MIDLDCYDLKACPGECPDGGFPYCVANPDFLALEARRRRAFARVAVVCGLVAAVLLAVAFMGVW